MTNQPTSITTEPPTLTIRIGKIIKDILQTVIATGIMVFLGMKILHILNWNIFGILSSNWFATNLNPLLELETLIIVAKALAYSAGIDLAYMLLTPGPDEAIEPLILGLASAILFSISRIGDTNIGLALEIGLYVIILTGLFILKALFIKEDPSQTTHDLIILLKSKAKNMFEKTKNMIKP